eukprot:Skav235935  [mRNA]  locus=scaffold6173:51497:52198:+ [translate_table: standard]
MLQENVEPDLAGSAAGEDKRTRFGPRECRSGDEALTQRVTFGDGKKKEGERKEKGRRKEGERKEKGERERERRREKEGERGNKKWEKIERGCKKSDLNVKADVKGRDAETFSQ